MITNNEERRIFRTGLMVERAIFPEMPLTYHEMLMLVPADILKLDHPKHKKVVGLIQAMVAFRITGIQQQMSAVRFRLDIHDYRGNLEKDILQDRLYELYYQAKEIDPEGTARFERMIDKRMRKVRKG